MDRYLKDVRKIRVFTAREEESLLGKIKQSDCTKLRDELIVRNLRFVITIAKKYQKLGFPIEDLVSEGNIGLVIAAKRFDPNKGVRFITYAVWWIRAAIIQALLNKADIIKLSNKRKGLLVKIKRELKKLPTEIIELSVYEDISTRLNVSKEEVILAVNAGKQNYLLSIDSQFMNEYPDSSKNTLGSAIQSNQIYNLYRTINELSEKERIVLILRYGLDGNGAKSFKEVGNLIHLSKQRIAQIEQSAKIRIALKYKKYGYN